jgi:tRNA (cmo5U34)-methyltransferase
LSEHFADPQAVARYAEGPRRIIPGFAHLQRMTTLLLAERVPQDGRVLVLGAGGGLELKVFAEAHPDWRFDGVDPSDEMLKLADATLGSLASRVCMHLGYIDAAPDGPFDDYTDHKGFRVARHPSNASMRAYQSIKGGWSLNGKLAMGK